MSRAIVGLHHAQIAIPKGGEARAREFFVGLLGFVELEKPADMAARGGAWFSCGAQQLHLGVEEPFAAAKKAHPAFLLASAEDVAELAAHLRAHGVEVRFAHDSPGVARFHVDDPFGNRLEFTAPT